MLLKKLINNLPKNQKNIKILGISTNSKRIKKGFIFFAIKGFKSNGEKFINEAIKKRASVIICSTKCKFNNNRIPIIKTADVRSFLSMICCKFFKLKPKNIIAVTGTNGKTSVADFFYQILTMNRVPVASIGTLGIKYKNKKIKSYLTSPETIFFHQELEKIKKNKIENVIIEASSHGLDQKRIDNLNIKAGIFTNFSQDHLDYHKTMNKYLKAKLILFNKLLSKNKSMISDKSINEFSILKKISKKRKLRLIEISQIEKKLKKMNDSKFNKFQIKNISMAIAAAKLCNLSEKKIFRTIKKIKDVDGRLELVKKFKNNIKVYVDFAHSPDALLKTIQELKNLYGNNISIVFGCGGDRDFKKRPLMARVASEHCKKIYITDDNPRNENPKKIRNEIIKNIKNPSCFNIGNRNLAIKTAVLNADPDEVILVAGKGHETQQVYKKKIISVSDKKIIRKLKINLKKISNTNKNYLQNKKILNELKKKIKIKNFHGLAIDSRAVKKNNLFLTIKGKNNDGSKFISNALKKGAKYVVSSKKNNKYKKKIIQVKNEINFLNSFAAKKRNTSSAKIIAITGSAGKTSLKNLTNELLKNFDKTFCSPKSYNNHYGVPLSLSQLNTCHKYGIFEVGMSKPGEIFRLSKLIKPHIGVITNIGEAHIENFKNLRGIADAKGEIINNIQKNGTLIINRDDKFFKYFQNKAKKKNLRVVSFGLSKKSDIHPISKFDLKTKIKWTIKSRNKILTLKLNDLNICNVLSSIAILEELKLDLSKITKYFENYQSSEGRGRVHSINRYSKNFKLIDESYNANPLSVKNAINKFNLIKKKNFKKYLLLGDMLELGKKSNSLHKELSRVINNSDIDKVFIKGKKTLITYKNINKDKRGNIFQQNEDVDFTLNNIIANNDYLMIKGSNATGLNNLSQKIIKGY